MASPVLLSLEKEKRRPEGRRVDRRTEGLSAPSARSMPVCATDKSNKLSGCSSPTINSTTSSPLGSTPLMNVSPETTPELKRASSWNSSTCSREVRLAKTPRLCRWGRSGDESPVGDAGLRVVRACLTAHGIAAADSQPNFGTSGCRTFAAWTLELGQAIYVPYLFRSACACCALWPTLITVTPRSARGAGEIRNS